MAASERRAKAQAAAAHLVKSGYPHGRRKSVPSHANYPKVGEVGSAAYRRLMAKKQKKNSLEGIPAPMPKPQTSKSNKKAA